MLFTPWWNYQSSCQEHSGTRPWADINSLSLGYRWNFWDQRIVYVQFEPMLRNNDCSIAHTHTQLMRAPVATSLPTLSIVNLAVG